MFAKDTNTREAVTKARQGGCTLPPGEAGQILNRLMLLEQVIGSEAVQQALFDTGCFDTRRCRLTRAVIFWVVLAMGVLTDLPIRQVVKYARRLQPVKPFPTARASAWRGNAWG